ncbi:Tetracycline repressor protein class B from transposon Tn10 [Leucobacter soli]|uniref:Tetracycline repressor protein class B from transposon Tn10 n=2 Tax=Leucobacter soli TaxID=2812850 RepID=A0A916JWM4_9MICO|nr:TetR/AcrR family transcriptional regulator C-terminal domain-containing protein [Leucobacter soli]CAG7609832.1 Tetracycline repressor protein class B from transposon Tn10 [Leucobacter soli]
MPLSRARIIAAAARVADRGGLDSVSMRTVAKELDVEAMSLYHHVTNKDALLDGLADWVAAQFYRPKTDVGWRVEMTKRANSLRAVLSSHPWGLGMIESRSNAGDALLRHHDAVLGSLLTVFPLRMAAHAFSILDAYIYGFVLTEVNLPFAPGEGHENEMAEQLVPDMAGLPHLRRMATELMATGEYSFTAEFEAGLDLILDGLERHTGGSRSEGTS